MSRKLARQSLVALAVLVVALMVAGLGFAGRQAYAVESGDGPPPPPPNQGYLPGG
jgi:hypothetical protein